MARYCPLFSGSSGNCTYIGTSQGGVLIDAGVSAKRIETALKERDVDPASIRAVFITHEHSDHIAGLRVLLKRYHYPVYTATGTREKLMEEGVLTVNDAADALDAGLHTIADMEVRAFHTSHDAAESMGYCIHTPDDRWIGVATDMGTVTPEVRKALQGCDLVHIESNHVIGMLENSSYPYSLKHRILSDRGHLSNDACAAELIALAGQGTARFTLAHLSRENNTPALAYTTARAVLTDGGLREGSDYLLQVARPDGTNEMVVF